MEMIRHCTVCALHSGLAQEDEELGHDFLWDLAQVLLPEDLLVLHDEDLGGRQQRLGVVEVGETEHLDNILHAQILDCRVLDLSFQRIQIVEHRELQEAGDV